MNLNWRKTKLKTGIISDYDGKRLAVIRRKPKEFHSYVDNVRLPDSRTKKEAVKKILEAIDIQGKLF
jgi:hypothetical protein